MEAGALGRTIFGQAVEVTNPYVRALLDIDGMTWGPRYVEVAVGLPQNDELLWATLGLVEPWQEEWGDPVDFKPIAENKLLQALRGNGPSSDLPLRAPWHLRPGDYLAGGGVCSPDGAIAVGVSGAYGLADEAIARVLLTTILQLYRVWAEDLRDAGSQRVP